MQELLNNGTDANVRDNEGSTPLIYAAVNGYDSIVRMLIQHGAKINIKDNRGRSSLHYSSEGGLINDSKRTFVLKSEIIENSALFSDTIAIKCESFNKKFISNIFRSRRSGEIANATRCRSADKNSRRNSNGSGGNKWSVIEIELDFKHFI